MKKVILIMLLIILFLLMVGFFISYNNKTIGTVDFVDKNNITLKIDNSTPLSDKLGKSKKKGDSGCLDFSIMSKDNNNKLKYELYIKQINTVSSINDNYIKLYLSESNTNHSLLKKIITFNQLKVSSSDLNAKRLYVGTINKNEIVNLRVKMWLADNYTISNEKKDFEVILGIKVLNGR